MTTPTARALPTLPHLQGRLLGRAHTATRAWRRWGYTQAFTAAVALERRSVFQGHPAERVERAQGAASDTTRTRHAPAPGWIVEHVQEPDRCAVAISLHNEAMWTCGATRTTTAWMPFARDLEPGDWHVLADGVVALLVPHRSADKVADSQALATLLHTLE